MMQAFSPREVNGYFYVGGDPVNQTDPSGTCFGWETCEDAADTAGSPVDDVWDSTEGVRSTVTSEEFLGNAATTYGVAVSCNMSRVERCRDDGLRLSSTEELPDVWVLLHAKDHKIAELEVIAADGSHVSRDALSHRLRG